jgi:quaternary ammonium compound-resistance protein SugE
VNDVGGVHGRNGLGEPYSHDKPLAERRPGRRLDPAAQRCARQIFENERDLAVVPQQLVGLDDAGSVERAQQLVLVAVARELSSRRRLALRAFDYDAGTVIRATRAMNRRGTTFVNRLSVLVARKLCCFQRRVLACVTRLCGYSAARGGSPPLTGTMTNSRRRNEKLKPRERNGTASQSPDESLLASAMRDAVLADRASSRGPERLGLAPDSTVAYDTRCEATSSPRAAGAQVRDGPASNERRAAMAWILLLVAGVLEVVWAYFMKQSSGFTRLGPTVITVATMIVSFALLSLAMRTLPLGTAYPVWTGIGAVGTFAAGIAFLGEPADLTRVLAALLIVAGLVLMKVSTAQ